MADYVVLYDPATGVVDGLWPRATSDNIASFISDGFLEVDGVHVCAGMATSGGPFTPAAVLLTDPTIDDPLAPPGALEVDDTSTPTDVVERGAEDTGRDPGYDYTA